MKNALLTLTLCMAGLFATGCEQQPQTPPGTVALIELDRIAIATGKDKQIMQKIQEKQQELFGRANTMRSQMQTQFRAVQQQFGEEPTDEQQAQLQGMLGEMQRLLSNEQMQANYEMEQFRSELATQLRNEVREPALAVAKERGFSIVFETNEAIVGAVGNVDITEDVIKRMASAQTSGGDSLDAKLAPPGTVAPLNLPSTTTNVPAPATDKPLPLPTPTEGVEEPASSDE